MMAKIVSGTSAEVTIHVIPEPTVRSTITYAGPEGSLRIRCTPAADRAVEHGATVGNLEK
jgi:hypothetical protein